MLLSNGEKGPALRRAFLPRLRESSFHDPALQISPDQSKHPLVLDPARHPRHQHVVVNPVEKLLQVDIDHPAASRLDVSPGGFHRLMRSPSGPKPVTMVGEVRFPDRAHHLMHRLLD